MEYAGRQPFEDVQSYLHGQKTFLLYPPEEFAPGELVKKKVFLLAASIENTGNGIYCYRTRLYSISHHYQIVMSLSTCC